MKHAAIVTVGSELVEGLRVDTNTAEIARALTGAGLTVTEATSVGDDVSGLTRVLRRLTATCDVVVTTGGLGPTHDDVTREAAASALGVSLVRDSRLEALLRPVMQRHADSTASEQVLVQADILDGSTVIDACTGTAPGLIAPTPVGVLVLLPGPPGEMRPMLARFVETLGTQRPEPIELGIAGTTESDAQVGALRVLESHPGIRLTVLARPGDVKVILVAEDAGSDALIAAADDVARHFGERVYSRDGSSLPAAVVQAARAKGLRIACAESCTGGLLGAALTSVPGASEVFCGSVVAYSNDAKMSLLDVPAGLLAQFGAVSEETARAMAEGVRERLGADLAVSITGIAGPDGGTPYKPVGLVWFGVADASTSVAIERTFPQMGREGIRDRAVAFALDALRGRIAAR